MANVYYKIDDRTSLTKKLYYCNTQKDGYELWDYTIYPPVSRGRLVTIEYNNLGIFYFPENASHFFDGCINETFELGNFYIWKMTDTTNAYMMFMNATNLKRINGGREQWDISRAWTLGYMFCNCTSLEEFPWGASNINTRSCQRMYSMFSNCVSLTDFSFLKNWDTSNVTDMSNMFNGCTSMTNIDISNWDMDNVETVDAMFARCINLEEIKVKPYTDWNDGSKGTGVNLFNTDEKLPNWDGTVDITKANTWPLGYFSYEPVAPTKFEMHIKDANSWSNSTIYQKINGVWIEMEVYF